MEANAPNFAGPWTWNRQTLVIQNEAGVEVGQALTATAAVFLVEALNRQNQHQRARSLLYNLELVQQVMALEADLSTERTRYLELWAKVEQLHRDSAGHNYCWRNTGRFLEAVGLTPRGYLPPPDEFAAGCLAFQKELYANPSRWPDFGQPAPASASASAAPATAHVLTPLHQVGAFVLEHGRCFVCGGPFNAACSACDRIVCAKHMNSPCRAKP